MFHFPTFCISYRQQVPCDPCVECDRVNVMLGEADEVKDEINNNTGIVIGKIASLNNVKNVCFCPEMFCPPVNQNILELLYKQGKCPRELKSDIFYLSTLYSPYSYL